MKRIKMLVKEIAELTNKPLTKEDAIKNNKSFYLEIEFSSHYGGYRLVNVSVVHGGHSGVFGESSSVERRSRSVMEAYLEGLLNGITALSFEKTI